MKASLQACLLASLQQTTEDKTKRERRLAGTVSLPTASPPHPRERIADLRLPGKPQLQQTRRSKDVPKKNRSSNACPADAKPPFRGFSRPNYTMVPDELFDELLPDLSGAELKVLLYIIRRTLGFKKGSDTISLSQMLYGIETKDGTTLDRGTGLSRPTLLRALQSLKAKNIIIAEERLSPERGWEATVYRLNFVEPADGTLGSFFDQGMSQNLTKGPGTLGSDFYQGRSQNLTKPLVKKRALQDTVKQDTVKQQTDPVVVRGRASQEARPAHTDGPDQERQGSRAQESEHLVQELRKRGVSAGRARQLVGRHAPGHIEAKMRLLDRLLAEGSDLVGRNPPGFLVRAIEEDYRYGEDEGSGDDFEGIWGRVVELMAGVVERPSQLEFIRDSRLLRVGEREAVVQVRDKYAASVVGEMLGPEVEKALLEVLGRRVRLRVVVG